MIDPNEPDFFSRVQAEASKRMNTAQPGSTLWFKLFDLSKSLEYAIAASEPAAVDLGAPE